MLALVCPELALSVSLTATACPTEKSSGVVTCTERSSPVVTMPFVEQQLKNLPETALITNFLNKEYALP